MKLHSFCKDIACSLLLCMSAASLAAADGIMCGEDGVEVYFDLGSTDAEFDGLYADEGSLLRSIRYQGNEKLSSLVPDQGGDLMFKTIDVPGLLAYTAQSLVAYTSDAQSLLRVFDYSMPGEMMELGQLQLAAPLDFIRVEGSILVGVREGGGLVVIDVSDPSQPTLVGEQEFSGTVRAMDLDEGIVSVATDEDDLVRFFDVTDPENPSLLSTVEDPRVMQDHALESHNGWVYSIGFEGVSVIDLGLPSAPMLMRTIPYEELVSTSVIPRATRKAADSQGDLLTMQFEQGGVFVFDISSPTEPRIVAQYDSQYAEAGVALDAGDVYIQTLWGVVYRGDIAEMDAEGSILDASEGLRFLYDATDFGFANQRVYATGIGYYAYSVYEIGDDGQPELEQQFSFNPGEFAYNAVQYQHYSYVAAGGQGLVVIDHDRPEGERELFRFNPISSVVRVLRDGRDLLVLDESGVMILMDITLPESPLIRTLASFPYPAKPKTLVFDDLRAYGITDHPQNEDGSLGFVLDLSVPFRPEIVEYEHYERNYDQMIATGDSFYAIDSAADSFGIGVLDRPSIREGQLIDIPVDCTSIAAIDDRHLLLGDRDGQLLCFDLWEYEISGTVQIGGEVRAIGVDRGRAYADGTWGSAQVVDVDDACAICPADLNSDGSVNFLDVAAFIQSFNAMSADADLNGDGRWDYFDIANFLEMVQNDCEDPFL